MIKEIVRVDSKQRYDLVLENAEGLKATVNLDAPSSSDAVSGLWWIKARQGHSIKVEILAFCFIDSQLLTTLLPCNRQFNLSWGLLLPLKIYPPRSLFTEPTLKPGHLYVCIPLVAAVPEHFFKIIYVTPGTQGLSKMKRNHIHLAQGIAGDNVISGMSFVIFFLVPPQLTPIHLLWHRHANLLPGPHFYQSTKSTWRRHQIFHVR